MKVVVRERKSWMESVKEVGVLKQQVIALTKTIETLDEDNTRLTMEKTELRQKLDEATSGMNAMVKSWDEAVAERDNARAEAANLNLELMERDCRVDELEKQVEWLRDKNEEWAQIANDQKATIVNYEAVIQSLQEEVERWKRSFLRMSIWQSSPTMKHWWLKKKPRD